MDVIPEVIGLKPSQVTPQFPFTGGDGRQYHMDFAIHTDKVRIAIELEGFDKTNSNRGKNRKEHDDFNRRIQSLTALGWRPLTITNAQFKSDPMHYANMIRQIISEPPTETVIIANQDNSEVLKSIEKMSGMIHQIASEPPKNPTTINQDNSEILKSIEKMSGMIHQIASEPPKNPTTPNVNQDNTKVLNSMKKIGIVGIAALAVLLAILAFTLLPNTNIPKVYDNCTLLRIDYQYGVARSEEDKAKANSRAEVNEAVYNANSRLDQVPQDGIACIK